MADSTRTQKSVRTRRTTTNRHGRASQRFTLSIDLADTALKRMMVEQCRVKWNYVTVYRGARADLVAAGVPESAFPEGRFKSKEFQVQTVNVCCTGACELLSGTARVLSQGYELEVNWGRVLPYVQGNHPAIDELARMLLKDLMAWGGKEWETDEYLEYPIDRVAADRRAVDYKPGPGAPRLRVTPEFHKRLSGLASEVFQMVHTYGEVCPSESIAGNAKSSRPALKLVVEPIQG